MLLLIIKPIEGQTMQTDMFSQKRTNRGIVLPVMSTIDETVVLLSELLYKSGPDISDGVRKSWFEVCAEKFRLPP